MKNCILGRKAWASLKQFYANTINISNINCILGRKAWASLKPFKNIITVRLSVGYPGPKGLGLIEAIQLCNSSSSQECPYPGPKGLGLIEASTLPGVQSPDRITYPGPKGLGLIEA